jgi:peroxiredoxin
MHDGTTARRDQMIFQSTTLRSGDAAPDFTLPNNRGDVQSLSQYLSKGPVLLAFHRGTW